MLVTEVTKTAKGKLRILMEDGTAFHLDEDETKRFGISPQQNLPEETVSVIVEDVLYKRARTRCFTFLKNTDKTVAQLRDRLREEEFPEESIRLALQFTDTFHYTDDRRYADNYTRRMCGKKSRKQIEYELKDKGVDRETIHAVMREWYETDENPEEDAIRAIIRKKGIDLQTAERIRIIKLYRYLVQKGYGMATVHRILSEST